MPHTVSYSFATRREAELAVEHLVQEHRIDRAAITLAAAGPDNTAGEQAAGADVESGHPGVEKHGTPALHGPIALRVVCSGSQHPTVEAALREVGGQPC
jgi:hypothetical protein